MLATVFEYVCMGVYPVMTLCVIFEIWVETFAYSDVAESCYKNPDKPEHDCQPVR